MKLRPSGQQPPKARTRQQRHARAFAFLHNHLPKFTTCRPAAKLRPSPRPSGRRLPPVGARIARAPHAAITNVLTEKTKVPTVFSKVLIEISKVLSVFPPPSRRAGTCGILNRVDRCSAKTSKVDNTISYSPQCCHAVPRPCSNPRRPRKIPFRCLHRQTAEKQGEKGIRTYRKIEENFCANTLFYLNLHRLRPRAPHAVAAPPAVRPNCIKISSIIFI